MFIATCGHEIDEGISCSVDEGEISVYSDGKVTKALTYGTYCAECTLEYYKQNNLKNSELNKLIQLIKEGN